MLAQPTRLLVLENDVEEIRRIEAALGTVQGAVEAAWGLFEITAAGTLTEALPLLRSDRFDVVLVSLRLPDTPGVAALIKVLAIAPRLPVVVLADEDDQAAIALIHEGAQDYLLRSERCSRLLTRTLRAAIQQRRAELELGQSRMSIVWRLAKAAEYRDEDTGDHVIRVGLYSKLIAEALRPADSRCDERFVENLFLAAPLHDIGKIGIPDAILRKGGPLTHREWTVMRQHCQIGADIIREDAKAMSVYRSWHGLKCEADDNAPLRDMACRIALTHHERWDGSGYPGGLRGQDIPLEGRIVAVSDVFDALVSERPYKPAYGEEQALSVLRDGAGRHFDPDVLDAFEAALPAVLQVRQRFADRPAAAV